VAASRTACYLFNELIKVAQCDCWDTLQNKNIQAVRVATQYAPARCTPDAATQLQPIPYVCGAQRVLLPIAVGAMNINDLMNINDVRESATIFPRLCKSGKPKISELNDAKYRFTKLIN